ncbi:DNA repair protein RecN [Chitinibacteraceae bacterium HSL-7]
MLISLSLKDFVLVDSLELEFGPGMTALTGETGAGKSILLDALGLLLGDRADSGVVRHGRDRAELSAVFDLAGNDAALGWLGEHALDSGDGTVLLRRMVDAGGKSRAFINGTPVTVQQLGQLGRQLVQLNGQHAHQALLKPDAQRALLDDAAGSQPLAARVAQLYRDWRAAETQLDDARSGAEARSAEVERVSEEVRELTALSPDADEWAQLETEQKRLQHAAGLISGVGSALAALSEGEQNCQSWLASVNAQLAELADIDAALGPVFEALSGVEAELVDAVHELQRYGDALELDPERLGEVEARMSALWRAARRYRCEPAQLASELETRVAQLEVLEAGVNLAALEAAVRDAERAYRQAASELSRARALAAEKLASEVTTAIAPLAMNDTRFAILLLACEPSAFGLEQVQFQVAHGATPLRDMAKTVSGGELSRISLALMVIAAADVPTQIFDEVDVGIGGRVAEVVGRLLAGLGSERQVLTITHLPQVAACAQHHLVVSKTRQGDAIVSSVDALDAKARVAEIARMLAGVEVSENTLKLAAEMLGHD